MACGYDFEPGSESCTMPTTNETLGRVETNGFVFRTKGPRAFDLSLNGTTIKSEWLDQNQNVINPSTDQEIADNVEYVKITITAPDSTVLYSFTGEQTAKLTGSPAQLVWDSTPISNLVNDINSSSSPIGMPSQDVDLNVSHPDYIHQFTVTINNINGKPEKLSNLRTGPDPLVFVQQSQKSDITTNGSEYTLEKIYTLDDNCNWVVFKSV